MPILLKPIQRVNPQNPKGERKWYPVQYTTSTVSEIELGEMIAYETTINPMEAAMVLRQLGKILPAVLMDGKSVKLGGIGTFNVKLRTEGSESRDKLTARNVKEVKINFTPDAKTREALKHAEFVWVDKIMETKDGNKDEAGDGDSSGGNTPGGGGVPGGGIDE